MSISPLSAAAPAATVAPPTIWGLEPSQLHERFWASRGVQVIRQGDNTPLAEEARLFLLMEPGALAIFELAGSALSGAGPLLLYVRVHDTREPGCHERVITDANDRFVRFERVYHRPYSQIARAAITGNAAVARAWQGAPDTKTGWRALRRSLAKNRRATIDTTGILYDGDTNADLAAFVRDLTRFWSRPDFAILRARHAGPDIWKDRDAVVEPGAKIVGPVWIGTGRMPASGETIVGPAILWDDPAARPAPERIIWGIMPWQDIRPLPRKSEGIHYLAGLQNQAGEATVAQARNLHMAFKRAFDIIFSCVAILLTLPAYPIIILAILIEDGGPIFFAHRRETMGGREFPCYKFRSMRKNAEDIKRELQIQNQADGPQFYMDNDPRLTRVGRIIRRFRLDELPQFFNVLAGHMSVVGPRPSPFKENQFCPAWREARLSVRPGITGLWQIKRTRSAGNDFQEWIKYDIEYVENARWSLDLLIIWKTMLTVVRSGHAPSQSEARIFEEPDVEAQSI